MDLLKGKPVADKLKAEVKDRIAELESQGKRVPGLVFIRVGEGQDSASYLRSIEKQAVAAGMNFKKEEIASSQTEADLVKVIESYNANPEIDGIICSMPLPDHMDANKIRNLISPEKDVEAQSPINAGRLLLGTNNVYPCTPEAVRQILLHYGYPLEGKNCVILGRSNILGKPLALIMLEENCTVTVCHSRTKDLPAIASKAEILISCMGRAKMVDHTYTNPDQIVVDVAINVDENGKMCGDIDFDDVEGKVSAITPVPGGVGPVTNAILMLNTLACYQG
ncbi:MAG: bifunctional 5,10-methylenetetrahydrofolate dehydrogenase/5,10-methenyltetrahydrofolate cyclohydrolase [Eubacteriales bacterium]|nr:bifunctional 5,10-methylenetetrahydrofolate dehydrogenase/5,10-methenyltetrahydrofolate cyclohydrolase [Eubacteriales bacterium]